MIGMECEKLRATSTKGQVLEIAPARPWYTNLDVICSRLMLLPEYDVVEVHLSIMGKMTITKNVFGMTREGPMAYNMVTKNWTFWQKRSTSLEDPQPSVLAEAWRISVRLPLKLCPLEDSTHAAFPPSIGLTSLDSKGRKVEDFDSPDEKIEYQVMASLTYRDQTTETIEIPILFVPLPIVIGHDDRVLPMVYWKPRQIDHRFSDTFKDLLQLTFGEMHTTLKILDQLTLAQDFLGFWIDAKLTIDWLGKPEFRPHLTGITPSIQIFQGSDQTHIDSRTKSGNRRKIASFTAEAVHAPDITQSDWRPLSAGTGRKIVHCKFFISSKKILQPSFKSCLMTRAYEMTLDLNLSIPKSIIRTRMTSLNFPIQLISGLESDSDKEAPWIKYCPNPNLVREELMVDSKVIGDYLEYPGRKPSYSESSTHFLAPAPMPRIPLYPAQVSEQEENRIPAWQHKSEGSTAPEE